MRPIVAIVGRPNVGKSTLVNRIAQTGEAIVHESRGVTRDRTYHQADWNGIEFDLVDTGGIEPLKSDDAFSGPIRDQALAAALEADAILFIVDGKTGATEEDESVARMLKRASVPLFLVVNKLDNPAREQEVLWEFYSLGVGEPHPISALHGHGTGDLLDELVAALPERSEPDPETESSDDLVSIAIIGRPNAGKSSLFNKILGSERSIVSDIAGTTRDAIDTILERDGRTYRLVDTAGIRKKSTAVEDIEYYSQVRGLRAIDRSDIALLVVDSSIGMTEQDQKVANLAIERGCALIILLNKWDLLEDDRARDQVIDTVKRRLTLAPWAQLLRISALTGRSIEKIWPLIDAAERARTMRISTSTLNRFVTSLREFGHTVIDGKRRLRMHYATQVATKPPTFSFFVNHPDLATDSFRRYVENRLREQFDLAGTPIRLHFRKKNEQRSKEG
ncbi:ribosome biogenesis GTPase Der [Collinsella sp. AGMB00827]|uniref:GTPase Der n=1 Tax=Collinsella ureilytica TaxID=2869515 RepID=A0ABS7MKX3_9ACTN|nr:ribosome biogenesis GTPase Der [Collinsella urealyticum]MBY4798016.1 ribosome biogenesis GTPase Der [Collinsella urealyticum]